MPKDYGINGLLPKGTLQLFRFLLAFLKPLYQSAFFFLVFLLEIFQEKI